MHCTLQLDTLHTSAWSVNKFFGNNPSEKIHLQQNNTTVKYDNTWLFQQSITVCLWTARNFLFLYNPLHKHKAGCSSTHFLCIYILSYIFFQLLTCFRCLWNCCPSWFDISFVCNPFPIVMAYLLYIRIKATKPYAE